MTDNIRMVSPVLLSGHPAVAGLKEESTQKPPGE